MNSTSTLVIGILLGQLTLSQAVHLDKHSRQKQYITDSIDNDLDRNSMRYTDASTGNYKTNAQYAEEDEAIKAGNIYKKLYPFSMEDDTGDRYTNTHRCFGGPCK